VSLEYLGSIYAVSVTPPPTLDRIVDSGKWREKAETEGETQREQGKGCKRRMMHHDVTINQKR